MSNATVESMYRHIERVVPRIEWDIEKSNIERILELKKQRNAIILAHTYQSPIIYSTIADIQGDSLQLARESAAADADVIVMCGVKFMAESAKILNPSRTVLLPDLKAGCSMADSITGEDVKKLKAQFPGRPVVTYVNTNADVKAEADICCTSSNAVKVVQSLNSDEVIFIPDPYLGKWVQSQIPGIKMILWDGPCEVHVKFTADEVRELIKRHPGIHVMAHPECPPEVLAEADFTGSTSGMIKHIGTAKPKQIALITECSMSSNVTAMFPELEVIRPCNLCPHMQRITLKKVVESLEKMQFEIQIPEEIRVKAQHSLDAMLAVS